MSALNRIGLATAALLVSVVGAQAQGLHKGAAVFAAQKCAMCHSLEGKGSVKGPLDNVGTKLTPEEIRLWIVDPVDMTKKASTGAGRKPAMKAYPNLSKEDVAALVDFLASKKEKKEK